jgi:hypothetical protein
VTELLGTEIATYRAASGSGRLTVETNGTAYAFRLTTPRKTMALTISDEQAIELADKILRISRR